MNEAERIGSEMRLHATSVIGFSALLLEPANLPHLTKLEYEVQFHAAALGLATNITRFMALLDNQADSDG